MTPSQLRSISRQLYSEAQTTARTFASARPTVRPSDHFKGYAVISMPVKVARPIFHVTYDVITPESSKQSDTADNGFVTPGEWKHSVANVWGHKAKAIQDDCGMTLREAVALCTPTEDCGSWFAESDSRINYRDGSEERRSLHAPRHISAASYARLQKLFGL